MHFLVDRAYVTFAVEFESTYVNQSFYGLDRTTGDLGSAMRKMVEVLRRMVRLAEIEKTLRRVSTLKYALGQAHASPLGVGCSRAHERP